MSKSFSPSSFFRGEDMNPKKDSEYGRLPIKIKRVNGFSNLKPIKPAGAKTTKIEKWLPD